MLSEILNRTYESLLGLWNQLLHTTHEASQGFGLGYFIATFRAFDRTFRVADSGAAMHLKSLGEEAYQQ
jgi:hypothetical protein